jgi:FecR protein
MVRILVAGLLALALPLAASAAAVVESVKGSARAGQMALAPGARFVAPTSIATGPGSQVTLKFDDGMQIVLAENSLMRMLNFRHDAEKRDQDRAVFELLTGGARVVTGRIAANNPKQFFFRTPHTDLTLEGPADFSVVVVNPAYVAVHSGSLISINGAGTTTLATGSSTMVATSSDLPVPVKPAAVPASVAASMKTLQTASVGVPVAAAAPAGAPAAGAPAAAETAATPGWVVPAAVVLGIAAAAAALGGGGGGGGSSTTSH